MSTAYLQAHAQRQPSWLECLATLAQAS